MCFKTLYCLSIQQSDIYVTIFKATYQFLSNNRDGFDSRLVSVALVWFNIIPTHIFQPLVHMHLAVVGGKLNLALGIHGEVIHTPATSTTTDWMHVLFDEPIIRNFRNVSGI